MTLEGHDCWEDCDEGPHGCVCGNDCKPRVGLYVTTTHARDLRPGDLIDLLPALKSYASTFEEALGYENDITAYEFARVESVAPAAPVRGEGAVIVCTDQHNLKLPALYPFQVEKENAS